jgi:hypothetical protein
MRFATLVLARRWVPRSARPRASGRAQPVRRFVGAIIAATTLVPLTALALVGRQRVAAHHQTSGLADTTTRAMT